MDVSCPACAARYTADDEKLRGKTARMRCKACNTAWLVSGPGAGSAIASAISTPPPASVVPAVLGPFAASSSQSADAGGAPSSKLAAVVKRGTEREKRDLFAEREPELGEVKQTLLPPPSFGFTAGARNEDSVLFRVDQIPATARTPEPVPATVRLPSVPPRFDAPRFDGLQPGPRPEDSNDGVIDLKALSEAPAALRPVAMPVAPLFSEAPPVTVEVDPRRLAKPTSKLRLIGGLAVAAIALMGIGVGVAYAFKGEEPVKHTPAAVAPPPTEAAPPPKPAEPPPAAAASSDDTKDKDAKEAKGKKGKKARGGKGKGVITDKTPPPSSKPVKAADPCGCKGDFNCILACTAKGGK
jgi:predicted Zn finger-like uncharacterized protein